MLPCPSLTIFKPPSVGKEKKGKSRGGNNKMSPFVSIKWKRQIVGEGKRGGQSLVFEMWTHNENGAIMRHQWNGGGDAEWTGAL